MASPTHGHEFEKVLGDGEGQGHLACCSQWDHKELDMTEQLNMSNLLKRLSFFHCIYLPPLSKIRCP